jgi:hypothetical protein
MLVQQKTSVDAKITSASSSPDVGIFLMHMLFSYGYVLKLCSCIFNKCSKFPCVTHTKSNWKWIPKYVSCDIRKRGCNCCSSTKHTQSSNFLLLDCFLEALDEVASSQYYVRSLESMPRRMGSVV